MFILHIVHKESGTIGSTIVCFLLKIFDLIKDERAVFGLNDLKRSDFWGELILF